jgi:hypothetical protein
LTGFAVDFARLCSFFGLIQLMNKRLDRGQAADIAPDDAVDLVFALSQDFGGRAFRQIS